MHRLISCSLVGYIRLRLNNIRELTITPTSPIQLILGTNGCGKSSFLEQLSPLPANKDDFEKGGKKVYTAYLDGRKVKCTSLFNGGSGHHSFEIDGEELNPGGTRGVQLELVETHFKITPAIHDLMRGAERFHTMNAAKRREWFTRMCDADYSFAMSAFEKLKERANWLTGTVKMGKKNLVVETAKIMSEAEENRLETEVNELLAQLAILQAERMPVGTSSAAHLESCSLALKALDELSMRLLRQRVVAPYPYAEGPLLRDEWGQLQVLEVSNLDVLDSEIDRLKHIVTERQTLAATLNEQFSKYQRQYELLVKTGAEGVEGLTKQIAALRQDSVQLVNKLRVGLVFTNAKVAREALDGIMADLQTAITALPVNSDRRYGRARYQELQERMIKLNERIGQLQEQLQRRLAQKEHADQHRGQDRQVCPKCAYSWSAGLNEEQYATLLTAIKEAQANLKDPLEEREQLTEVMKGVEAYFDQYREVMTFTKNVTVLKPLWDHLVASQLLFDSPIEANGLLRKVEQDLIYSVELQLIEERVAELEKLKVAAAEAGDAKLEDVKDQMDMVSERLGLVTSELTNVSKAVVNYSEYRRQLKQALEMADEVKRLQARAEQAQADHVEAFRRECIRDCIGQVEQALALRQESLRAAKMQRAVVAHLLAQLEKDEVHELAAKTMVKALSPTHGLIAEGLLGFIRNFVGEMNAHIGRIWSYPLQVLPTGYNNDSGEQTSELDYKFKLVVERESNLVPDVAKGSEGIREIVDWAFMRVAAKYLGLSDSPCFLDEFGKPLDDQHRFKAMEEIRWMMENGNYPQLFIISHYASAYGGFKNAEICVLDDRNISIPDNREYNKHVQIVH